LLDAGPVIGPHECGLWHQFIERFDVVLAETVYEQEALFHSTDDLTGFREPIDLVADVRQQRISVESATSIELSAVTRAIGGAVIVHDGERESLALLLHMHGQDECRFCAADGAALQAAAIIGLAERCVSLEELLMSMGIRRALEPKYGRRFAEEHLRRGQQIRLFRA